MTGPGIPPIRRDDDLPRIVEALLFATDEPLTVRQIIDIFAIAAEGALPRSVNGDALLAAIEELNREYEAAGAPSASSRSPAGGSSPHGRSTASGSGRW